MDGSKVKTRIDLTSVPVVRREVVAPARIPRPVALFAGLLGPVVAVLSIALEPVPTDPDATTSFVDALIGTTLLGSWVLAGALASLRRPSALGAAMVVAGISLAMALGCPLSGHHAPGTWWFGQLAVSGGALAAARALRRRA